MTKSWTPGPWNVFPVKDGEFPGIEAEEQGFSVVVWGDEEDGAGIKGENHENMMANAYLIAAAPELYEALEAILKWTDAPSGENRFKPDYEKAIAALSKARGE